MASTSETGHAKNVANFNALISFVIGYGDAYNPSREAIQLPALQTLGVSSKETLNQVYSLLPANKNSIAAREASFNPLSKLVTRVMNALKASGASSEVIDNVKSIARKIQGSRASAKLSKEEIEALAAEGKDAKNSSSSQMSYDSRLDNLDKLIKLLESIPEYAPNETELTTTTLTAVYTDLMERNTEVITTTAPLSNARIARNQLLYAEKTGLVDIALGVKTYVKSVYGASSPQYKQISKLAFKDVKI